MLDLLQGPALLVQQYPLVTLALLILLDTAFGVVPIEISVLLGISMGLSPVSLGILGAVFSVLGALVDYLIGLWGLRIIHLKDEERDRGRRFFQLYGSWSLLLIRLIPFFPSKPISILAGGMQYSAYLFVIYTGIGSFLRFYIEAEIFQRLHIVSKVGIDVLVRRAYEYATDLSSYATSLAVMGMALLLYYLLVMRTNEAKA